MCVYQKANLCYVDNPKLFKITFSGTSKRRRKERAERDRDFKGREQIFTGSKTKKYIYSVVLGIEGVGLEAEPARGSVCYIDL